jgi:hypothetical protein
VLPQDPSLIKARDYDLNKARKSYIKNCLAHTNATEITDADTQFLAEETKSTIEFVKTTVKTTIKQL